MSTGHFKYFKAVSISLFQGDGFVLISKELIKLITIKEKYLDFGTRSIATMLLKYQTDLINPSLVKLSVVKQYQEIYAQELTK